MTNCLPIKTIHAVSIWNLCAKHGYFMTSVKSTQSGDVAVFAKRSSSKTSYPPNSLFSLQVKCSRENMTTGLSLHGKFHCIECAETGSKRVNQKYHVDDIADQISGVIGGVVNQLIEFEVAMLSALSYISGNTLAPSIFREKDPICFDVAKL